MSNEIKCPHCGKAFTVDESGYAAILNQVRDQEFQRELADRERLLDESRAKEIELACAQVRDEMGRQLTESREKSAAELAEEQRKLVELCAGGIRELIEKQKEILGG